MSHQLIKIKNLKMNEMTMILNEMMLDQMKFHTICDHKETQEESAPQTSQASSSHLSHELDIKPSQPKLQKLPINTNFSSKKTRSCNASWYNRFDWLEYNIQSDAAFCFACKIFGSRSSADTTFTVTGFRKWTNALDKDKGFMKHQKSEVHKVCYKKWKASSEYQMDKIQYESQNCFDRDVMTTVKSCHTLLNKPKIRQKYEQDKHITQQIDVRWGCKYEAVDVISERFDVVLTTLIDVANNPGENDEDSEDDEYGYTKSQAETAAGLNHKLMSGKFIVGLTTLHKGTTVMTPDDQGHQINEFIAELIAELNAELKKKLNDEFNVRFDSIRT
ncbi:Hypothetical predicted protein [Paramuricea clavata]|uniref:Uncharacterized protein n=1 Tax=Paramuricea clavata TaxID=317549 RepID=A0A6S7G477_PARCT|nr:Hypothetical predicted protein [Paramuricea clavata]